MLGSSPAGAVTKRSVFGIGLLVGIGVVAWQLGWSVYAGERLDPVQTLLPMLLELAWMTGIAFTAAAIVLLPSRRLTPLGASALVAFVFGVLLAARIELAELVAPPVASASSPFLCAGGTTTNDAPASWYDAFLLQPVVLALSFIAITWRDLLHRIRVLSPRTAVFCSAGIAWLAIDLHDDHVASAAAQNDAFHSGVCVTGPKRTFNVSAISLRLTLNRFGDHDPSAFMYVLDHRIDEVRAQEQSKEVSTGLHLDPIQPLVLRANAGECLEIVFTNRLEREPAGLHLHGLALQGDGERLVPPGESLTYRYAIPARTYAEGTYYLHDRGSADDDRIAHGLFGAVIVEPEGSRHLHPNTGEPLADNNWEAIIAPPAAPAFREFVLFFHTVGSADATDVLDADGRAMRDVYHRGELYLPGARAINYRSEPRRDRLQRVGGEFAPWAPYNMDLASTPIPRSYVGEPTKMRVLHGGTGASHGIAFHPHGGQMKPDDPSKKGGHGARIAPGVPVDLSIDCSGRLGCLPTGGDFVFRCDMRDHILGGMWATWRVFASLQPDLAPLPDRLPPPDDDAFHGLIGKRVYGKVLVPRASLIDFEAERALEDWFRMVPPPRTHEM